MCLYPYMIYNKKYLPNEKNKGKPPRAKDERVLSVPIQCGKCEECKKAKAREWQIRLMEEIKTNKGIFITLTFNEERLNKYKKELTKETVNEDTGEITTIEPEENAIATIAVRKFLERWRKDKKVSVKHWLITELGHKEIRYDKEGNQITGTERIHLHGILFTNETREYINKKWKNGFIYYGKYCNEKTINYIIKYITKTDEEHPKYQNKILTSAGIGKMYTTTWNAAQNRFKEDTNESYKLNNGSRTSLPIYYRNKIYTDEERESLWLQKLDKQERYINGIKYKFRTDKEKEQYLKDLKYYQIENKKKGYGERDLIKWNKEEYIKQLNRLNNEE